MSAEYIQFWNIIAVIFAAIGFLVVVLLAVIVIGLSEIARKLDVRKR